MPDKHNPNQFMVSQNVLYNCLIEFLIFSPRSSVFEAHFQEPSTLQKVKIVVDTLVQHLE